MRKIFTLLLLLHVCMLAHGQLIPEWKRTFLRQAPFYEQSLSLDKDGNSYILCNDYDAVPYSYFSVIVKYNSAGFLEWEKEFRYKHVRYQPLNQYQLYQNDIVTDNQGNAYFMGSGASVSKDTSFLVKLDKNGNTVFEKIIATFDSLHRSRAYYHYLSYDKTNNLLYTLSYRSDSSSPSLKLTCYDAAGKENYSYSIPGGISEFTHDSQKNTYVLYHPQGTDSLMSILKAGPTGKVIWDVARTGIWMGDIRVNTHGNLLLRYDRDYSYEGVIMINSEDGTIMKEVQTPTYHYDLTLPNENNSNVYILSVILNSTSTLLRYNDKLELQYSVPVRDSLFSFHLIPAENNSVYLISDIQSGITISKFDPSGKILYTNEYPELWPVYHQDDNNYNADSIGSLYLVDYKSTNGRQGFTLTKLCSDCTPNITGTVFFDADTNCIAGNSEKRLANRMVTLLPDDIRTFTDSLGRYGFIAQPGAYTIKETLPKYWQFGCDSIHSFEVKTTGQVIDTLHFSNVAMTNITDLAVSISSSRARPGFDFFTSLSYLNKGITNVPATLVLKTDTTMKYLSADITPDIISADSLVWSLDTLAFSTGGSIKINFHTPAYVPILYSFSQIANIAPPQNDYYPPDNTDTLKQNVFGSCDPNEKSVFPLSLREDYTVWDDQPITYQVDFQNTGNDTAFTVAVYDDIDTDLDLSTFEMIGASHPYTVQIKGRTLIWTFNNILLADSTTNEALSHGFVKYKIGPVKNPGLSDVVINNTADIYFDYNLPVITNTVTITKRFKLPITLTNKQLYVFPNPTPGESVIVVDLDHATPLTFELYDLLGRNIITRKLGNVNSGRIAYKITGLDIIENGIYLAVMRTDTETFSSRLLIMK